MASQVVLAVKNLPASTGNLRDTGSIPGQGRSPGEGHGHPLQYSGLKNPMDRGAWQAMVHRVTKSQTRLKRLNTHTCAHTHTHVVVQLLSHLRLFVTPWTVALGSSVHGILQATILDWIASSFFGEYSQCRDRTHVPCVSYIGRWILYHQHPWQYYSAI